MPDESSAAARDGAALRLVGQALDLPDEDQGTFLERAASDDPLLLALARQLLAATRAAESHPTFLVTKARDLAEPVLRGVDAARRESETLLPKVRAALGRRFVVGHEIGRGGAAVVYRARDLASDRDVALKLITRRNTDKHQRARFLREIAIASALRHPRIVSIFESGEVEDAPYYVMPLASGGSLRQRMDRGPLSLAEIQSIVTDVAAGLDHAHSAGIVHRDIKPQNILLDAEHAMVADFGIALALEESELRFTSRGVIVGTVAYLSPERASGESQIDHRTDIYGLGCVTYELLVGVPPYTGPNARTVMRMHVRAPIPDALAARPDLAPAFSAALHQALAKAPADRFATASAFAAALNSA